MELFKKLILEYQNTYSILYKKDLIIDHQEISFKKKGINEYSLTWSGKNDTAFICFDEFVTAKELHKMLLDEKQYSLLMFDRGIFQLEYIIDGNNIKKQRMLYFRPNSIILPKSYFDDQDLEDIDIKGFPILLRADYDPENSTDIIHPSSHFVISNVRDCRIAMKANICFYNFVKFILEQFYNCYITENIFPCISHDDSIVESEKTKVHINW